MEHDNNGVLPRAQSALLAVLVQQDRSLTAQQLSVLSGYSVRSSSFANVLGALRSAGYAAGGRNGITATTAGVDAAGSVPPLPSGPDLVAHWMGQVSKAERALLGCLLDVWPEPLSADDLAATSGYSRKSSSFADAIGQLRTLRLAHGGSDGITATDELGQAHNGEA